MRFHNGDQGQGRKLTFESCGRTDKLDEELRPIFRVSYDTNHKGKGEKVHLFMTRDDVVQILKEMDKADAKKTKLEAILSST